MASPKTSKDEQIIWSQDEERDENALSDCSCIEDDHKKLTLPDLNEKRPLILVEVVIFLYFVALATSYPVLQFYLYQRFSEDFGWTGGSDADQCSNGSETTNSLEDEVQRKTNDYIMYAGFITNFVSIIPTLLFGNLADRYGRKFVVLVTIIGQFLYQTLMMCVMFWRLQPQWFFLSSAIQGLSGHYGLFLAAAFGMVADFTPGGKKRLLRVTTCEGSIAIAASLATVLSGVWVKELGYIWPMVFSLGVLALSFIFACFFLPETHHASSRVPVTWALFVRCFQFYVKDTASKRRFKLIVCLICFLTSNAAVTGDSNISILYLLSSPFCWVQVKITIFGGVLVLAKWIVVLTVTQLGKRWISESGFTLLGVLSAAAGYLCKGLASGDLLIYVGAGAGILSDLVSPMCRAIMSKAVASNEQGAIFAGIGVLQMVMSTISGVMFSSIYKASLSSFPGLPYVTMSGLALSNVIFLIFLIIRMRQHSDQGETFMYAEVVNT